MGINGKAFKNSLACEGVSFVAPGAPLDITKITIDGRYPELGYVRNLESSLMAYVIEGVGSLAVRNSETVRLEVGDAVYVPAGEWYAWKGNRMTIIASFSPAFDPEQYEIGVDS